MLSGCIPVFFYSDEEFASLWPFHMGGLHGWGANASVRVPLEAVPEARIRAMQSMLAAHAHTLLYGIGPYSGDAIETMLAALHAGLSRPARARH
jgi:hypothetical protein